MPEKTKPPPRLITIDAGAAAIYQRFQGWPDTYLTDQVLSGLVSDPASIAEDTRRLLQEKGVLRADEDRVRTCIPIAEQMPIIAWSDRLQKAGSDNFKTMRDSARYLADSWTSGRTLPAWSEVAHSLLLGYVLWTCGSRLILRQQRAEVAAVILAAPDQSAATWLCFVRANQEYGVSTLLGGDFVQSARVHELLLQQEVGQALYTLASDRSLLVLHPQAARVLLCLDGLTAVRANANGLHYAAWPVLGPEQLNQVKTGLQLLVSSLSLFLSETVGKVLQSIAPTYPDLLPADLALLLFALLTRLLADDWRAAGILPKMTIPELADLK